MALAGRYLESRKKQGLPFGEACAQNRQEQSMERDPFAPNSAMPGPGAEEGDLRGDRTSFSLLRRVPRGKGVFAMKRLLLLLLLILLPLSSRAATVYFGNSNLSGMTSIQTNTANTTKGSASVQGGSFTAPGGTPKINEISLYAAKVGSGGTSILMAVYDNANNGAGPLNLVCEGIAKVPVNSTTYGWVGHVGSSSLTGPCTLTPGAMYNIYLTYDNAGGQGTMGYYYSSPSSGTNNNYNTLNNSGGWPSTIVVPNNPSNYDFAWRVGIDGTTIGPTEHFVRPGGSNTSCNGSADADYSAGVSPHCAWATPDYPLLNSLVMSGDILTIHAMTWTSANIGYLYGSPQPSATTTIRAYPGDTVNFNITAGQGTSGYLLNIPEADVYGATYFKGINFTNTNNTTAAWFNAGNTPKQATWDDCTWDYGSSSSAGVGIVQVGDSTMTFTFNRNRFKNASVFLVSYSNSASTNRDVITFNSCLADTFGSLYQGWKLATLNMYNNTLVRTTDFAGSVSTPDLSASATSVRLTGANTIAHIHNNIWVGNGSAAQSSGAQKTFLLSGASAGATFLSNPSNWDVTNNIVWNTNTPATWDYGSFDHISINDSYYVPMDKSNRFMDPGFVNYGTSPLNSDLHLGSGSIATGRGLESALPSSGDLSANNWTGNDVGCYANPVAIPPTLSLTPNTLVVSGHSIPWGTGASVPSSNLFNVLAAMPTMSTTTVLGGQGTGYCRALPALKSDGYSFLVDYIMWTDRPSTVTAQIVLNDILNYKAVQSASSFLSSVAASITQSLQKIADYGARPIWVGDSSNLSTTGSTIYNGDIITINQAVEAYCAARSWSYGSILERLVFDPNWEVGCRGGCSSHPQTGDYYDCIYTNADGAGCSPNLHPNNNGHSMIASLMENLYWSREDYWTADATYGTGAPTVSASATYMQPITVAGINANSLPTGQTGRIVRVNAPSSTTFIPHADGAPGKLMTLENPSYLTNAVPYNFSGMQYWVLGGNGIAPPPPAVTTLQASPTSVASGGTSTLTVTLSTAAPTGGSIVTLSSNNAALTVPASVTVAAGSTTGTFTATAGSVSATQSVTVTATLNGTATTVVTVTPPAPAVSTLQASPTSVASGGTSTLTVTLSTAAPTGGSVVTLSSNNAALTVPASVTVAAGSTTGTFTATAGSVSATQQVTVTATLNGSATTVVTVTPPAPAVTTLQASPTSVASGGTSTLTVTLSTAAPTGGSIVTLSSNNAALTVPASVTVAAGPPRGPSLLPRARSAPPNRSRSRQPSTAPPPPWSPSPRLHPRSPPSRPLPRASPQAGPRLLPSPCPRRPPRAARS